MLEGQYQALLKYCGIDQQDPERLGKLREVPIEKLIKALIDLNVPLFSPLPHPDFFPVYPTSGIQGKLIKNCPWLEDVMIGDTFFEGYVLYRHQMNVLAEDVIPAFHHTLGAEKATKLLEMYGISPGMDRNLFWQQSMLLTGDIFLSEPIHSLATSLTAPSTTSACPERKVFRYTATLRNPFPGSHQYQVPGHHAIDLTYMFGNLVFRMPLASQRAASIEWMRRWVRFGAGLVPWVEHESRWGRLAIADARLGWIVRDRGEDEERSKEDEWGERRYKQWEYIAEILNALELERREVVRFQLLSAGRKLIG